MLVNVNVDQQEVREMLRQQIEQAVKEADHESVFWDTKELKRRTCMSWTAIQETFFFEPGFPKERSGRNGTTQQEKRGSFLRSGFKDYQAKGAVK